MTQSPYRSRFEAYVTDADAAFLRLEKDRLLRHTISAVMVLDRAPERSVVMDRVERMSRLVPGCRHRLQSPPLGLANPRWVVDRDFDLSHHVRWIAAPDPRNLDTVLDYARQSATSGLDRDRPLWNITVVERLDGGQAAVVVELHHVLTDGVGGMSMLPVLVDNTRDAGEPTPLPAVPDDDVDSSRALFLDAVAARAERFTSRLQSAAGLAYQTLPRLARSPRAVVGTASRNLQALRRTMTPPRTKLSPIMVDRRGWSRFGTLDVDLEALKGAARSCDTTVNDAFTAAVAYGMANYHNKHGSPVERLRAAMAVNTRRPGDSPYGNYARGGTLVLPAGADDPAMCMRVCHEAVALLRDDVRQPLTGALVTLMSLLGPFVAGSVGAIMKNCDFALSNVPGIDTPLFLAGAEILAIYGFGPTMGTAANIALVSYRERAFIGCHVDAAAVPDVDVLIECLRLGFDAVLAVNP